MTRSDMVLLQMAIRQRWRIADKTRDLSIEKLTRIIESSDDCRMQVAAIKTLLLADSLNLEDERLHEGRLARLALEEANRLINGNNRPAIEGAAESAGGGTAGDVSP